jgi:hypothetical protein
MTTYTQAQYNSLAAAIATGATRVTHEGHTTEFRSLDDMLRLLALMDNQLNPPTPYIAPTQTRRAVTSKGLY